MALGTPYKYIGKAEYKKFESLKSQGLYVKLLKKKPTVYVVDITGKNEVNINLMRTTLVLRLTCLYNGTNMFAVLL